MSQTRKQWTQWTHREQAQFEQLYKQFKRDFQLYEPHMPGRTWQQIKSYYYNQLSRNKIFSERNGKMKEEQKPDEKDAPDYVAPDIINILSNLLSGK